MDRIDQDEVAVGEVFRHVVGNLLHAGLERGQSLVAHDGDESVVGLHVPGDDEEVVPVVEGTELRLDGVVLLDVLQDVERLLRTVEQQAPARVLGKVPYPDHPQREAELLFGVLRNDHDVALDGRHGLYGPVDVGRNVAAAQNAFGGVAEERFRELFLFVQPQYEVRHFVLLDNAHDRVRYVDVVPEQRIELYVGRGCRLLRSFEYLMRFSVGVGVRLLVVDDVQRIDPGLTLFPFEEDAQVDEFVGIFGVFERDEDVFAEPPLLFVVGDGFAERDVACAPLCRERSDGAGDENHHDGTVEHAVVQQSDGFACGGFADNDVVAHGYGGEGRGGLCVAQAEDDAPFVRRVFERFLREECREVFGQDGDTGHDGRHRDGLEVAEKGPVVDQHAHADEEERNEDGIAYELHAVHQRGGGRDQLVEREPREEGADDPLHAGQLGQNGTQKHEGQHEDVLRNALFYPFEKPSGEDGEEKNDDAAENDHRYAELCPEVGIDLSGCQAHDDGQYEQREGIGNDRTSYGHGDGPVFRDAVFADDGVGDEGVRGEHAGQQYRGLHGEVEAVEAGQNTERHGNQKRVGTEKQTSGAVAPEIAQVYLEACEKHDVEQTGRTGEDDAAVALHQVDAVGADDRPGDDESEDGRYADFVQQQGCEQNDRQDDEEFQYRICQR